MLDEKTEELQKEFQEFQEFQDFQKFQKLQKCQDLQKSQTPQKTEELQDILNYLEKEGCDDPKLIELLKIFLETKIPKNYQKRRMAKAVKYVIEDCTAFGFGEDQYIEETFENKKFLEASLWEDLTRQEFRDIQKEWEKYKGKKQEWENYLKK